MTNIYVSKIRNAKAVYGTMLILLAVTVIAYIGARVGSYNENIVMLIFAFLLAEIMMTVILIIPMIADSYILSDGKIIIYTLFKKREIAIDKIPTIIVTNNISAGQSIYTVKVRNAARVKVACPLIGIIDKDIKSINCHYDRPINNWDIQELLNNDAEYVYGMLCNQAVIRLFEKEFKGELYVARTVYENFKDEISQIYEAWEYEDKAIKILWDEKLGDQL